MTHFMVTHDAALAQKDQKLKEKNEGLTPKDQKQQFRELDGTLVNGDYYICNLQLPRSVTC